MSVTFAPRERIPVNASWPGVSRKVTVRLFSVTVYAPMCCVIPPDSPEATSAWRIRSRRLVFPWSTCPRIVTTGGRDFRSSGRSVVFASETTSSACRVRLISTSLPNSRARMPIASSGTGSFILAIRPFSISL